jgi:peptide/nickel transport system substrate-binding protein
LLDEMGLKKGADGKRAKVTILLLPYGEAWVRLGEYVRQSLIRIGVDTTIESVDAATWSKRAANWEFQITFNFLYQFSDPALGVSRSYISSNIRKGVLFTNTMGYSNPRVDELFAKAAQTNNEAEAKRLYTEVQQILADEVPVAWLLELEFPTIYNKKFKNLITTGIGANESYDGVWME